MLAKEDIENDLKYLIQILPLKKGDFVFIALLVVIMNVHSKQLHPLILFGLKLYKVKRIFLAFNSQMPCSHV